MLLKVAGVVGLVIIALGAVALWQIGPRNVIGMIRYDRRAEGKLRVGDLAPDLTLTALDGSTRVSLREHIGARPLVVVFGSYT